MCEGPARRGGGSSKRFKGWRQGEQQQQEGGMGVGSPKAVKQFGWRSPAILSWRPAQAWRVVRAHPLLVLLAFGFLAVIPFEYTVKMVAPGAEPYDAGFVVTESLYQLLKQRPSLNHVLAAANTVLVMYQIAYIAWVWVVEGRFRPTLASLFMYSSRGLLGYSTQLPVPQDFLGSKVDFPVGDSSFFLFFSGHVGASIITALDLRRVNNMRGALLIDTLNVLQTVRLLATRGHYTIDLAGGAFAGWASYYVAELYEERMKPALMASISRVAPPHIEQSNHHMGDAASE